MKQRIQVSIHPGLVEDARRIMAQRKIDSVSECLEILIRDEWERRQLLRSTYSVTHPPAVLNDSPATPAPAPAGAQAIVDKLNDLAGTVTPLALPAKSSARKPGGTGRSGKAR